METRGLKLVYAVVARKNERTVWIRIGRGWANRDGSLHLELDAVPMTGVLQVRDMLPLRDEKGERT